VEAGAHGLPSVAFHGAGGVTESIIDGTTGLLARSDDVVDFVDKVRLLVCDQRLRARLGQDAKTFAARFSWDSTVKEFDRLLSEVSQGRAISNRK
jgi:glycosyltransferase involved in cell wall biosynthesis